jgi:hypothetical protein
MGDPAHETTALQLQTSQPSQSFEGNDRFSPRDFAAMRSLDAAVAQADGDTQI